MPGEIRPRPQEVEGQPLVVQTIGYIGQIMKPQTTPTSPQTTPTGTQTTPTGPSQPIQPLTPTATQSLLHGNGVMSQSFGTLYGSTSTDQAQSTEELGSGVQEADTEAESRTFISLAELVANKVSEAGMYETGLLLRWPPI